MTASRRMPDFIIIGAMKSATSTLHNQLGAQSSIFMSSPKEPNFFSDDDIYNQGLSWYSGLFSDANGSDICGESSTHYTKLPDYPIGRHVAKGSKGFGLYVQFIHQPFAIRLIKSTTTALSSNT